MKHELTAENKRRSNKINRVGYSLFMALVVIQLILGDHESAVSNMAIALIFDPFADQQWESRSKYQKAWLLIHLTLLAAGAAFLFLQ